MSLFSDYIEGVPVKISEKYKPPPRIELPHIVNECSSRAQAVVDKSNYYFNFEHNILAKLTELRNAKETFKIERRHRMQLREEAKQKQLDVIAAAEAEEKLKQLSVSEVSYPSTEEISEISPDDKTEKGPELTAASDIKEELKDPEPSDLYPVCSVSSDSQLNILQPIQVKSNNYQFSGLLDDPDPLQGLMMTTAVKKMQMNSAYSQNNIDNLTYSDFEQDTSSPFDNVELKTINDLELLAQVLQSQRNSGLSSQPSQSGYVMDHSVHYSGAQNCGPDMPVEPSRYHSSSTYSDQPIVSHSAVYSSPQHYPVANGYYVPTNDNICDSSVTMENVNSMYMGNYNYYPPSNLYTQDTGFYQTPSSNQHDMTETTNQVPLGEPCFSPQTFYYSYPQTVPTYPPVYGAPTTTQNNVDHNVQSVSSSVSQNTMKSRSRSVPDIVRELSDEVASAKLRTDNRSYNESLPAREPASHASCSMEKRQYRKKSEKLPNPFEKLPSQLQSMCKSIQGMGFPLDRVARVCTLIGNNDKKIIEGLLIMGQLMDLGFSESKVSAALAKHEFNRDKALDELVS